jgi:hypothetical protein
MTPDPIARPAPSPPTFRLGGMLLTFGSAVFIVGVVRYALLPPELAIPAAESSYPQVLQEAAQLGAGMALAGRVIFFGDVLIAAAALSLMSRRRYERSDLERVGWALIFASFIPAFVFDSLMGSALPNLAINAPAAFPAFKAWYDFQFAAGNVPFGLGGVAIFYADLHSPGPLLPHFVDYLAIAASGLIFLGGVGYVLGLFVGWQLNGPLLLPAALALAALGIQIARTEK